MPKPSPSSTGITENVPAYRGKESKRNVGSGLNPRQPSYRGKTTKGSGVSNTAAYDRKGTAPNLHK